MHATTSPIELFFLSPATPDPGVGSTNYSSLYLLRRDVNFCFGIDHATGERRPGAGAALFPGTMTIMAGIDLLAKCWRGDDAIDGARRRFKDFLKTYFGLNAGDKVLAEEHAESIYQLRNGLLHAFGLFSRGRSRREYKFILTEDQQQLIRTVHRSAMVSHVWIDLRVLRQRFEEAIDLYRRDLSRDADLRSKFIPMFKRYGVLHVDRPGQPWFGTLLMP